MHVECSKSSTESVHIEHAGLVVLGVATKFLSQIMAVGSRTNMLMMMIIIATTTLTCARSGLIVRGATIRSARPVTNSPINPGDYHFNNHVVDHHFYDDDHQEKDDNYHDDDYQEMIMMTIMANLELTCPFLLSGNVVPLQAPVMAGTDY